MAGSPVPSTSYLAFGFSRTWQFLLSGSCRPRQELHTSHVCLSRLSAQPTRCRPACKPVARSSNDRRACPTVSFQDHPGGRPPKLLDHVRHAIRVRHYSRRTEEAYVYWVRRFIVFHRKRHRSEMGALEVSAFLEWLAVRQRISASTQNQALCALLFLYRNVLKLEIGANSCRHRARGGTIGLYPENIESGLADCLLGGARCNHRDLRRGRKTRECRS